MELLSIRDGSSIISAWVEHPSLGEAQQKKEISFSGIIPGGYTGREGLLFTAEFRAISLGSVTLALKGERPLLNDGVGSSVPLRPAPLILTIVEESGTPESVPGPDTNSPEPFIPIITNDQALFEGKHVVIFNTQDKSSGIDYYEVLESWWPWPRSGGEWKYAVSPHVLTDQKLSSYIHIKVVDKAGNEYVVTVPPQYTSRLYARYVFWSILIVVILAILYLKRTWWAFVRR